MLTADELSLSVFDHFVGSGLKGLRKKIIKINTIISGVSWVAESCKVKVRQRI